MLLVTSVALLHFADMEKAQMNNYIESLEKS
nr:MAG TPA: hypothetical protein [Caudoviricetes sp.]